MKKTIDDCKFARAMAVLDKVDNRILASSDESYQFYAEPWFLETLRLSLKLTLERYND
jgi:hypothetical protein